MSASYRVDWAAVAAAVDMACAIRQVTYEQAAVEAGIPPSSISRLRHGKHLSADGLAALMAWCYPSLIPLWVTNEPEVRR